ncbi:MAG: hypothetical protein AABW82_05115 [Nanoarchaeota archaeon]
MGKVFIEESGPMRKIYDPDKKIKHLQMLDCICGETQKMIDFKVVASEEPLPVSITHGLSYFGQRKVYKDPMFAEPGEKIRKDGFVGLEIIIGERLGFHNMEGPLSYRVGHQYDFSI